MRSRLAILLAFPLLTGLFAAEKEKRPAAVTYGKQVTPLLQKYCLKCHSGPKPRASFSLDRFTSDAQAAADRKTWEKVLRALQAREMPPEDKPQPAPAERDLLLSFLDQQLAAVDCTKARDPGRVTIRRLNKAEYNNTIRDLLAVPFSPAEDFPSDDVGYGFDNIGDVLTLSPLLMEKYLAAAERIVAEVLVKRTPAVPVRRFQGVELRAEGGNPQRPPRGQHRILTAKGELYTTADLPVDGEYILRVRAFGERAGSEPARMVLRVEGRDVKTFDVRDPDPRDAKTYEVKTTLKAGSRRVSVAFANPHRDEKSGKERTLAVMFLEVEAPRSAAPTDPHAKLFIAQPSATLTKEEAARKVLSHFLRRAFRRPVAAAEVERYLKLYRLAEKEGEPFDKAVGVAVQGALCSPHFLFRIEKGPEPGQKVRTLNDHELAIRLSYFLWSTMPDDELFALAEKGKLRQELEPQVRRMLRDEKAKALTENFAGQWLQTRSLRAFNPDRNLFPQYDAQLRDAMIREVELFFEAVIRDDLSILKFINADFTFVNERLARHYGLRDVSGQQFRRVDLRDGQRGGVLTMAAVLTTTSNPTRTSPVKRGKFILENILNSPPPPPPPGAGELSEEKQVVESAPLRQRMEMHRAKTECASCHARMDAMGFAFENFDAVGGWRTMDGKFPIDPAGKLPSGEDFKGPADLKKILVSRSEDFARCLGEKMLTYAIGRGVEYGDKCAVDDIVKALRKDDFKFSRLVLEIVKSDPFQKRRGK
jgi:hypothetical protein